MKRANNQVDFGAESESPIGPVRQRLLILAVLMLIIVGSIAGLVIFTATAQPENYSGSAATVLASGVKLPDLSYPGATRLVFEDKDLWPEGKPPEQNSAIYGLLVTPDDLHKIEAFYREKLKESGYTLQDISSCTPPDCESQISFYASSNQLGVNIFIIEEKALRELGSLSSKLRAQVKPGQILIAYQLSPIVPTPVPATGISSIAPPTQIPVTPVNANSQAFIGPDNNFHTDDGTGLVSTSLPITVKSADGKISLRLEWLVVDHEGTRLGVTVEGDPQQSRIGNNIGTLVDESGLHYKLSYLKGSTVSNSIISTQSLIWQAPTLPVGSKVISFEAGEGFPFKPNIPVSIQVASFKEAHLPQATTFPAIATDLKGLKVRVPYAYFGPDRTVLLLNTEANGRGNFHGLGMLKYGSGGISSLIAKDDTGRVLEQAPLPGPTPAGGHPSGPPLNVEANGDVLVALSAVTPGSKNLTLKFGGYPVSLNLNPPGKLAQPAEQGGFKVPLAELLKSGEIRSGPTLELQGVKVQIKSMQATLNQTKQEVDLTVKAFLESEGETLGQLVPGSSGSNNLILSCYQCLRAPQSGFTATPQQQQANNELLPFEFHFIYQYDSAQTEVQLAVANLNYVVLGPWKISLPIPSHP